jgi:hypothetical protein
MCHAIATDPASGGRRISTFIQVGALVLPTGHNEHLLTSRVSLTNRHTLREVELVKQQLQQVKPSAVRFFICTPPDVANLHRSPAGDRRWKQARSRQRASSVTRTDGRAVLWLESARVGNFGEEGLVRERRV